MICVNSANACKNALLIYGALCKLAENPYKMTGTSVDIVIVTFTLSRYKHKSLFSKFSAILFVSSGFSIILFSNS